MFLNSILIRFYLLLSFFMVTNVLSQIRDFPPDTVAGIPANYTESKVGTYTLPDPLVCFDGQIVDSPDIWINKRRNEILSLFEQNQFGKTPLIPYKLRFEVTDDKSPAFDGKALRTQTTVYFSDDKDPKMDLLLYVPSDAKGPVPLLLYISFRANSMAVNDPGVKQGFIWNPDHKKVPAIKNNRWKPLNVEAVLEKGFGFATVYYGDIEPDFLGGAAYGVRGMLNKNKDSRSANDGWGSIGVWSWGLSRALDYFETIKEVDAKRVTIMGVSRLGKTVLWAAALDERFACIIPVCSGESGAALSRRNYGETIAHITAPKRFPYWFVPKYQKYSKNVNTLPVDAHMLLGLLAPRPVLLVTGNMDKWSDPYGEFLAAVSAESVYNIFEKKGLNVKEMPAAGVPIFNYLGFYMHDGGHGMEPMDWDVILEFMAKHLIQ